jgi:hypothetical protein
MPEMMLAALSTIRTVEDMVAAFRDEEHCRRLAGKHGMAEWQDLPCLRLQALDRHRRPRHGQEPGAAGSLSMLQR